MPHNIPKTNREIAKWANQLIQECNPDLEERIQRGAMYRNLYLTGDENGNPATYPKTFSYISNLASFLFSPITLRYQIRAHNGGSVTQKSMGRVASSDLFEMMREAGVYSVLSDCVEWGLVKGKTILKLNWEDNGFSAYMIQPEFFGVHRPDIHELAKQDCFVHSTYYTPGAFVAAFRAINDFTNIMKKIIKQGQSGKPDQHPERANALKQIVLGGLNPFQQGSQGPTQASSRGIVNWLGGPQAIFDPRVMANLIRLDELWVKDAETKDWATFQLVGDVLVTGGDVIRNAMADMFDPNNAMRRLPEEFRENNPLSKMHPFVEVAPNQLNGYFWGRSEICNIGAMQMQINARLNGISRLLRRQEKPPQIFQGSTALNQVKYSALDFPGGFFADPTPATMSKLTPMYPQLPQGLWESLHELEQMYDNMSGLTPVLQGRGEGSVRSTGHANTLTRNSSPRFKDRALDVERSVAEVGHLAVAYLKAMDMRTLVAWLPPDTENEVAKMKADQPWLEPPAKGMKQYPFRWYHIPDDAKVTVDAHSSCPIFSEEFKEMIYELVKMGAMTPQEAIEHLHPPGEDDIIADQERKEVMQAQMLKEHPELLPVILGAPKKKH